MDRMYSQRMDYLNSAPSSECFLCVDASTEELADNLVLARTDLCVVVMNRFPYNTGHLLVSPRRHVGNLEALEKAELDEVMQLTLKGIGALKATMNPEGFNVGANLGSAAGAGVPGHLHMHIVPRWPGDTNFMPVVGETKVLPEVLHSTFERLRQVF